HERVPRLQGRNLSMASYDGFAPILLLFGFASLVTAVAAGVFSIMSLRRLRRETIARQGELAQRLRMIESRLDGIEAKRGTPAGRTRGTDDTLDPSASAWHKEPAAHAPARPTGPELRSGPTLIAVPALAAPSSKPLESLEGGPGDRHVEILALAAAGVSPGE